jgi:hypothetical protein
VFGLVLPIHMGTFFGFLKSKQLFQPPTFSPMPRTTTCPRCQKPFVCQPESIADCQCAGIALSPEARVLIGESPFSDCLCLDCLRDFQERAEGNNAVGATGQTA